ncbi:MAG: hypothetical protein IKJ26_08220 [Clostridia bacterium]|nr:hypothetical protein [Clostridia bacterium]
MMTEKPKYYNQSRNKASQKYQKENLEQIAIRVPKGDRASLKAAAEQAGESMAQYIVNAVNQRAGRKVMTPSFRVRITERSSIQTPNGETMTDEQLEYMDGICTQEITVEANTPQEALAAAAAAYVPTQKDGFIINNTTIEVAQNNP